MSSAGSRSLFRGALMVSRRSISSFNKTPPAPNKGHHASTEQAMPIGAFYEAVMHKPQPIPETKPEEPPVTSTKSSRNTAKKTASAQDSGETVDTSAAPAPSPTAEPATAQEKAKIIFGTRLAGPVERAEKLKALQNRSTLVAGVLVPPRPEEPDNCCMSGCVNCVWDQYRDDMGEWASANSEAEKRLQEQQSPPGVLSSSSTAKGTAGQDGAGAPQTLPNEAMSMDDDGGGSAHHQPSISKNMWDEDLYKDIPVGIREFMKTEKKLKTRHQEEGSVGG
ncbi:oxidoreductase-like protein [Apiospora marii]|uniref:Oxidoreductase-like protein n=1 Tax=Apiospora marii TaxID=335849 RepID=A0ABR1RYE8_9PEZI